MFIHIFVDIKCLLRNSPRLFYFMESIIYNILYLSGSFDWTGNIAMNYHNVLNIYTWTDKAIKYNIKLPKSQHW